MPLSVRPAAAQLAPTGGHYANQPSDTGFTGGVSSSGGYSTSVPLDLPGARNGLPGFASSLVQARPANARPQYTPDESLTLSRVWL